MRAVAGQQLFHNVSFETASSEKTVVFFMSVLFCLKYLTCCSGLNIPSFSHHWYQLGSTYSGLYEDGNGRLVSAKGKPKYFTQCAERDNRYTSWCWNPTKPIMGSHSPFFVPAGVWAVYSILCFSLHLTLSSSVGWKQKHHSWNNNCRHIKMSYKNKCLFSVFVVLVDVSLDYVTWKLYIKQHIHTGMNTWTHIVLTWQYGPLSLFSPPVFLCLRPQRRVWQRWWGGGGGWRFWRVAGVESPWQPPTQDTTCPPHP